MLTRAASAAGWALEKAEHEVLEMKRSAKPDSEAHQPIDRWVKETGIQEWGRAQQR